MNRKITLARLKAKRFRKKTRAALSRRFDFTVSLKNRRDPAHPWLSLNLKGEIPREVIAFLAALGFITAAWALIKLIRKCF